ncbi:hypothetical protein LEP1GSC050_0308 [Leptospira broomii serovar Hurstbridge str. 5399]|uniref:Uncharacterized protein n=1 Tax=Leptospira broomii serovar Hurstbridge str. 5399 TaxID=1049789 RepID=T0F575_9LEPT|nr:hypothetical protein LEP1GSC050_0308 [Leptospira broomii serovar Hurstbridge str. 5399]
MRNERAEGPIFSLSLDILYSLFSRFVFQKIELNPWTFEKTK